MNSRVMGRGRWPLGVTLWHVPKFGDFPTAPLSPSPPHHHCHFQACLQPGPVTADPTSAVTIICQEEEEEEATLVYAVPPLAGTTCGLSLERL